MIEPILIIIISPVVLFCMLKSLAADNGKRIGAKLAG
jgi:hypothetical protein